MKAPVAVALAVFLTIRLSAAPAPEALAAAQTTLAEGHYEAAKQQFTDLIAQTKASEPTSNLIPLLQIRLGEAHRLLGEATAAEPILQAAYQALQRGNAGLLDQKNAAEAYAKTLSQLGKSTLADAIFQESVLLAPSPDQQLQQRLTWAEVAMQSSNYQTAARELATVRKAAPQNVSALHLEGRLSHMTGRYAQALACYRLAIPLASADIEATLHTDIAIAACRLGDANTALAAFAAARASLAGRPSKQLDQAEAIAPLFLGRNLTEHSLEELRRAIPETQPDYAALAPQLCNLGVALHLAAAQAWENGEDAKANLLRQEAKTTLALAQPPASPAHPLRRHLALNQWCLALDDNRTEEALQHAETATQAALALLPELLGAATEEERLAFRLLLDELSPVLSMAPENSAMAEKAAELVINAHGLVLEQELAALQLASKAAAEPREAWLAARRALAAQWFTHESNPTAVVQLRQNLSQAAAALQSLPEVPQRISLTALAASIPPDGVFILYTLYQHYRGGGAFEPCYAALLLGPDAKPQIVKLDYQGEISRLHRALRDSLSNQQDEPCQQQLAALSRALWKPLSRLIPSQAKQAFLCVDGSLADIPFPLLASSLPGKNILESGLRLTFVATPRALLRGAATNQSLGDQWLAVDAGSTWSGVPSTAAQHWPYQLLANLSTAPLPGCAAEASLLRELNSTTQSLEGNTATETSFRQAIANPSLSLCHFAGHGSVSQEVTQAPLVTADQWEGPLFPAALMQSAVLFPELSSSLSTGQQISPNADGCLFPAELGLLDLRHLSLLTLASCHSGGGSAAAREGLFDFARAGHAAGVRDVLVCAWAVADAASSLYFRHFYASLKAGTAPPQAAWEAQAALWQASLKSHRYSTALLRTGPFRLVRSR